MATLFKPKIVTYRLPDGSYRTPDGKRVTKRTPNAVRTVTRSKKWYGRYTDGAGKPCREPLAESKEIARKMLAKLAGDAQLASVGVADKYEKHRGRPLLEHLEDFRDNLTHKGNVAEYVDSTYRQARAVIDGCGFEVIDDIEESLVVEFLARVRQPKAVGTLDSSQELFTADQVADLLGVKPEAIGRMARRRLLPCQGSGRKRRFRREDVEALLERRARGTGVSTSNHYLVSIKAFTKWLVKNRRTDADPLVHLSQQNPKVDVRRERRAASVGEFSRLVEAAGKGKPFRGLSGNDRVHLYILAAYTGLRASELASLTPASFDLGANPPGLTVQAAYSKHRRKDEQTLRVDLAEVMRAYLDGKPPHAALWPGSWAENAAEMLRIDLEAASVPYEDGAGLVFDFHGTRHTFITRLAEAGVAPGMAKDLARHSTIVLTMDHYTHLGINDQTAALDKLPALPGSAENKPAAPKTLPA
jgi:excisionase family DNA binding protein